VSVEVRHITKRFGAFTALRDVNLAVKCGELVALLGPSGSGKTTLLRVIAGLEEPDPAPGRAVLFEGKDVTERRAAERRVGFVFQHYALFRHMTVFENVAFGLRVRPRRERPSESAIQEKVRELLQLVQLEGMASRYPHQLSGGQRQRVALARALAIEPKVLLLDEPFGALDAKVRQNLRRWLRRLHERIAATTILVTHDQEEALEVADRIVIMNRGAVEQEGAPEQVFHHPATSFVMDFLGSVNLFHGRIESGRTVIAPVGRDLSSGPPLTRLFVRPYDLSIHRTPVDQTAIRAKVVRVLAAGPVVKIDLESAGNAPIYVEMAHDRFRQAPVSPGDDVFVSIRDARVFHEDYTI